MGLKKGQTNNPNGRPRKGQCITELLRDTIDKDKFVKRLIALAMPENIEKTDFQALKLVMNYLDGMPVQTNINANTDDEILTEEEKQIIWKNLKKHFK